MFPFIDSHPAIEKGWIEWEAQLEPPSCFKLIPVPSKWTNLQHVFHLMDKTYFILQIYIKLRYIAFQGGICFLYAFCLRWWMWCKCHTYSMNENSRWFMVNYRKSIWVANQGSSLFSWIGAFTAFQCVLSICYNLR